ncbi:MAG TPA: SPOR domain-containing protein [Vicinamibacterales bacterium]|nr:SPOR domain-containing protein [Vicinamibacterales bacterium]
MSSQTPDDGFHEIQLNGKQLVFLFMAATVVSVVIFLCGVLVGRGVRAERATQSADNTTANIEPAPQAVPAEKPPAGSDPTTAAAPPPTVDDLSYFNRLEKQTQPQEDLKAPAKTPASASAVASVAATADKPADKPALAPAPPKPTPVKETAPPPAPPGDGYVIQVAAMPEHGVADAMAKRLTDKGYSAFVMTADGAKPTMYRVRIGRFKTKREAETVASKLQKEEQFKPWITR